MAMTGLAKISLIKGEKENAELFINKAIDIDPNNSWMYHELGVTYFRIDEYYSAKNMFEKAILYNNKSDKLFNNLGWNYYEIYNNNNNNNNQSYLDKSFDAFNNSLNLNPLNVDSLAGIGTLFYKLNKTDKAIENFNTVLKIDPKHKLTLYRIGRIFYELKQYNKSINMLKKAIEADIWFYAVEDRKITANSKSILHALYKIKK